MYNKVMLIGTIADLIEESIDPDAARCVCFSLRVPPPPDAPPTYWGVVFDMRAPTWPVGDDLFLIICREPRLCQRCLLTLRRGDVVCVEGRLVLTAVRSNGDIVPVAEILASDITLVQSSAS